MKSYQDNNTRKYHRSSVLAFPKTCDYACAIERVAPSTEGISKVVLYSAIALFVVLCLNAGYQMIGG